MVKYSIISLLQSTKGLNISDVVREIMTKKGGKATVKKPAKKTAKKTATKPTQKNGFCPNCGTYVFDVTTLARNGRGYRCNGCHNSFSKLVKTSSLIKQVPRAVEPKSKAKPKRGSVTVERPTADIGTDAVRRREARIAELMNEISLLKAEVEGTSWATANLMDYPSQRQVTAKDLSKKAQATVKGFLKEGRRLNGYRIGVDRQGVKHDMVQVADGPDSKFGKWYIVG